MNINFVKVFSTQKRGNTSDEYEDAYAHCLADERSVVAVSDGATEASFSKQWAKILVRRFVDSPTMVIDGDWLLDAYKEFYASIDIDSLPWHAQNKILEQGSFATLLGLEIDHEQKSFFAVAVGDSCLFWFDEDSGFHSFPQRSVDEFDSTPYLIATFKHKNEHLSETDKQHLRPLTLSQGKTTFYLMTDAIAHWFMNKCAKGDPPHDTLLAMTDEHFEVFISELREKQEIKNDDVTVVIMEVINDDGVDKNGLPINE